MLRSLSTCSTCCCRTISCFLRIFKARCLPVFLCFTSFTRPNPPVPTVICTSKSSREGYSLLSGYLVGCMDARAVRGFTLGLRCENMPPTGPVFGLAGLPSSPARPPRIFSSISWKRLLLLGTSGRESWLDGVVGVLGAAPREKGLSAVLEVRGEVPRTLVVTGELCAEVLFSGGNVLLSDTLDCSCRPDREEIPTGILRSVWRYGRPDCLST
mmetsp:Transcript_25695/g.48738  ORF Transcript_25695/g.48738 Transcript_25695/m.48738 type:complete len:213 (-) Transcript_25695:399-1037(-)